MLTVEEVAHWLNVTPRSVYRMVEDGRLRPAVRVLVDDTGETRLLFALDEVMRSESNLIRHTRRGVTV